MKRVRRNRYEYYSNNCFEDKIYDISELAGSMSIDWLDIKANEFWEYGKKKQLDIIDKNLDKFIDKYKEDIYFIIENQSDEFLNKHRNEIVKHIRKTIIKMFGE